MVFDRCSIHKNIRFHRKAFRVDNTAGVFSRTFIVKNIQFFDVHCGLFMRLHISIGCHDFRISAEFKSFFADHVHRRSGVDNKFPFLRFKELMQASTYVPKVRRMVLCVSPLISEHFWPASTLFHGHIALAIPTPPETDPQILERWCCADEVHLGKSIRAKDFGHECQHDVTRLS